MDTTVYRMIWNKDGGAYAPPNYLRLEYTHAKNTHTTRPPKTNPPNKPLINGSIGAGAGVAVGAGVGVATGAGYVAVAL